MEFTFHLYFFDHGAFPKLNVLARSSAGAGWAGKVFAMKKETVSRPSRPAPHTPRTQIHDSWSPGREGAESIPSVLDKTFPRRPAPTSNRLISDIRLSDLLYNEKI